jgi:outer membrane lipoprotein-sorting protein
MKKIIAALIIGVLAIASGCIGEKAGLTEEKVLTAIQNIETASYNESFSMSVQIFEPHTNKTANITTTAHVIGAFNKSAGLEMGNITINMRTMGMNINMDWPYFTNGSSVYFNIDGKWYLVPPTNDLYERARGSLNVDYIEKLLEEKNVTFKELDEGYAFRVNLTFWELANATNRTAYLKEAWGPLYSNITINTNRGWVEVHFRNDGTPTFIETYMDVTITLSVSPQKPATIHEIVHDSVILSNINEPINIKAPREIENAGNFEDVFWMRG